MLRKSVEIKMYTNNSVCNSKFLSYIIGLCAL